MAIVLRSVKGSPLTISEVDSNFTYLDTNKLDKTGGTSLFIGTGSSNTRFPNAISVLSNTAAGIQQNEPHNIGLVGEGTGSSLTTTISGTSGATSITVGSATGILIGQLITGTGIAPNAVVTNIVSTTITVSLANTGAVSGTGTFINIGVGLYGKGYASGAARSGGVVGEGHVSATGDTASAIGVRGYANDTHAGGLNIGLYGDATGGSSNYALYINRGGVYSVSSLDITAPSLGLPVGGTSARPGTPAQGYLRFNSDLTTFEGYNGSKWGSIGGGLTPTSIKTTNGYVAASNDLVRCDTTGGAFSITFPTLPTDGDIIGVVDITGNFNTANLTINRGGTTTIESDTQLVLDMNGTYVSFVYSSTGTNWKLLETPIGSLGNVSTGSLSGMVKGSGTVLSNAVPGTDYVVPGGSFGTPTSGNLSNCTNLSLSTGVTGTLPVANGGTGVTTSTGSGNNVLSTSATLITPLLGTPTSGDLSNCTNAVGYKLKSATTTIDVSAATAPTVGQLLIATDSNNATWQTSPYLPLAGGTMTGLLTAKELALTKTAPTISAGVLTLNFSLSNTYAVSLNASITSFTVSNIPTTGSYYEFNLEFTADGTARSVTWTFSGVDVKWPSGTAPTLTSTNGKKDTFVFYTYDAGTTWLGFIAGQNL